MKSCTDCKWMSDGDLYARCMRPRGGLMVTDDHGNLVPSCIYVNIERGSHWLYARLLGTCGREARFFEEKDI